MFDVEVDGVRYRESDNEDPGDEAVLTETADGVEIGLSVCYDLRFPELYRLLAVDGARILTVPAAFTVPTTRDHWEPLSAPARSRTRRSSSPPTRSASTRRATARAGGR